MTATQRRSRTTTALLVLAVLAGACTKQAGNGVEERLVERSRDSMGSELRLSAWTADEAGAVAAFDAVFGESDRLGAVMSVG